MTARWSGGSSARASVSGAEGAPRASGGTAKSAEEFEEVFTGFCRGAAAADKVGRHCAAMRRGLLFAGVTEGSGLTGEFDEVLRGRKGYGFVAGEINAGRQTTPGRVGSVSLSMSADIASMSIDAPGWGICLEAIS